MAESPLQPIIDNSQSKPKLPGFLSDKDIETILDKDLVICGYEKSNLTDIGYNLTPTEFIFSVNEGLLAKIHNDGNQKYCYVEPNDTVLIITREAIWVSEEISGTFHSKVSIVSQGFGHISTTLDAHWEGPLLISLNNPTKKRLRFVLGEDKGDGFRYKSFVTLIFYRMVTLTKTGHDNPPCRMDILKKLVRKNKFFFSHEKYVKLQDVIDTIRDFESLQVNIGKASLAERNDKIDQFKKKYKTFTKQIEFHISQAQEINRQIVKINTWIKYIVFGLSSLPIIYFCWPSFYDGKTEREIASFSIFVSTYVAIYTLCFNKYILKGD